MTARGDCAGEEPGTKSKGSVSVLIPHTDQLELPISGTLGMFGDHSRSATAILQLK